MDDNTIKLGGQIQAMEMVLKTMIALQLSSQVKDETGFVKAAEMAGTIRDRLLTQVAAMRAAAPPALRDSDVSALMIGSMEETVRRCFDQPREMLTQVADIVLELSTPASEAKN